jgi:hypothetical protein
MHYFRRTYRVLVYGLSEQHIAQGLHAVFRHFQLVRLRAVVLEREYEREVRPGKSRLLYLHDNVSEGVWNLLLLNSFFT